MITLCGFGVSNYYNKLKLVMLEKQVPFCERVVYPWQRETFLQNSPLGKIPFIETEHGGLSESQSQVATRPFALAPDSARHTSNTSANSVRS